jgi:histidinol-phosphate aminotransferase
LLLCLSLVDPGGEIVMASGSFINYLLRATQVGAKVVRVPLRDYTHDLETMVDVINERTQLAFVCNPNNPTGTVVDATTMEAFLERVPEQVAVVLDEACYEYITDLYTIRSVAHLRAGRQNLIVLRSFSKVYGLAGLRLGTMLAHEQGIDNMERARSPFNVSRLAQVAALAALGDDKHVRRSIEADEAAKAFFYQALAELDRRFILSYANFVAFDTGRPGNEISDPLLERGFITTPLDNWGVPNHVRFSFGAPEEDKLFTAALKELVDK